ncbi:pimeloyl-ACP methyl ester carboxylesterase [Kribbella aluminosa]|uniref:Pimeloyl-ACP methyl ester carboxylesterase n=1 Tax=Kribbella aluminosa TaxID=416017 RepID=A0ABS4UQD0_9ACTN|nr:alpha/beta hydrolase [Kribbella aluminosa]MBP2353769.1 pimeloyl-ACP methyl ester carboxylesterase [Kribbella aluminosa]
MRFVLIPGAASTSWHWHRVTAELRSRGYDVIPVDLPCDDPSAGLPQYVDTVVNAVPGDEEVVLVAHSLGGFTGTLACERLPVREFVLVAAMVPAPGERIADWWGNTGYDWVDGDVDAFFHDLPPEFAAEARRQLRTQSDRPMNDPCAFEDWPDVPTRAVIARDDLLFPAEFLRRVTQERLGFAPDEVPGAHFPMLGRPAAVVDYLLRGAAS